MTNKFHVETYCEDLSYKNTCTRAQFIGFCVDHTVNERGVIEMNLLPKTKVNARKFRAVPNSEIIKYL